MQIFIPKSTGLIKLNHSLEHNITNIDDFFIFGNNPGNNSDKKRSYIF